jgi:hypothetical protein
MIVLKKKKFCYTEQSELSPQQLRDHSLCSWYSFFAVDSLIHLTVRLSPTAIR